MKNHYEGRLIASPTLDGVRSVAADYEVMLVTILDAILERFERRPGYPFIDTKINILTGEDFPDPADPSRDFRGSTAIYGWILGRGLEALAGHVRWLASCSILTPPERDDRVRRLRQMIRTVLDHMEALRAGNGGRIAFLMTPDGRPFEMSETGVRRFITLDPQQRSAGDLFYSKGLAAAAHLLGDAAKLREALAYFRSVLHHVEQGSVAPDRVSFDVKNPAAGAKGKEIHGPRMLSVGGCATLGALLGDEEWFSAGERLIRHVVARHINHGQHAGVQLYDFTEATDAEGKPWREDGRILSDPGHALEFVGLAAKFLVLMRQRGALAPGREAFLSHCSALFPEVLIRNYENGRNRPIGGICKAFDLLSRTPINSDLPWWNLPETMRAAAEVLLLNPATPRRAELLAMIAGCSNAFVSHFVNRKAHLMAYQTVSAEGRPVDVIPATSDADPGYHTGLSIIDFLACLQKLGA